MWNRVFLRNESCFVLNKKIGEMIWNIERKASRELYHMVKGQLQYGLRARIELLIIKNVSFKAFCQTSGENDNVQPHTAGIVNSYHNKVLDSMITGHESNRTRLRCPEKYEIQLPRASYLILCMGRHIKALKRARESKTRYDF